LSLRERYVKIDLPFTKTNKQPEKIKMQTSLIIESNGSGKEKLEALLREGYTVVSITANHGRSYNDFLIILEKKEN